MSYGSIKYPFISPDIELFRYLRNVYFTDRIRRRRVSRVRGFLLSLLVLPNLKCLIVFKLHINLIAITLY